jgi:hypothetical protein
MSRGLGRTQRELLAQLADGQWQTVLALAGGAAAPRAVVESVRRAARRLSDQQLIELEYIDDDGRSWSSLGGGRSYYGGGRPVHPGWKLAARKR